MAWTDSTAAVRRRHLDAGDAAFAQQKLNAGYPASAVAKMIGRSVDVVRQLLPEPPPRAPPVIVKPVVHMPITFPSAMMSVGAKVAAKHGVTLALIRSQARHRSIAHIRQELCWELYELRHPDGSRRFSQPQIGRFVGYLDHTPVNHALKVHGARMRSTGDVDGGVVAGDEHPKTEENQSGEVVLEHRPHPSEAQAQEA